MSSSTPSVSSSEYRRGGLVEVGVVVGVVMGMVVGAEVTVKLSVSSCTVYPVTHAEAGYVK